MDAQQKTTRVVPQKTDEENRRSRIELGQRVWIVALVCVLGVLFADYWTPLGSPYRLLAVNFIFTALPALAVAIMFGRSFLVQGAPGFLLLGCGSVIWSASGFTSHIAFMTTSVFNANSYITIRNLCIWESSLLYFFGAVSLLRWRFPLTRRAFWLAGAFALAIGVSELTLFAVISGWIPVFFVEGKGGTLVRNLALASTVIMLFLTNRMLKTTLGSQRSPFIQWYNASLSFLAVSSAGLLFATSFTGKLVWTSQSIQYISSFCMFMAGLAVFCKRDCYLEVLARPKSNMRYAYVLAFVLVCFAATVRLIFLQVLGNHAIFITFYPAVMVTSLYGGFRPGAFATLCSALFAAYLWVDPVGSFLIQNPADQVALPIFLASGIMISWISGRLRQTDSQLRKTEATRREELEGLVAERTMELSREVAIRRQVEVELRASEHLYRAIII